MGRITSLLHDVWLDPASKHCCWNTCTFQIFRKTYSQDNQCFLPWQSMVWLPQGGLISITLGFSRKIPITGGEWSTCFSEKFTEIIKEDCCSTQVFISQKMGSKGSMRMRRCCHGNSPYLTFAFQGLLRLSCTMNF